MVNYCMELGSGGGNYLLQSPRLQGAASLRAHPRPPLPCLNVQLAVVLWMEGGGERSHAKEAGGDEEDRVYLHIAEHW